ncbi:MAG: hypothetical protein VXX85_00445 [Candidatus Margulisiibacteriota bacterium]|nr:hypothetical protein [Candidatus Margulisiibacteriota bacterium]
MTHQKRFSTFEEAESKMKDQVIELCKIYANTIKASLPVIKKALSATNKSDQQTFQDLFNEGNDHLHNLVQLELELKDLSNDNRGSILEISSEVLANTVKFLDELPKKIASSDVYQNTPSN